MFQVGQSLLMRFSFKNLVFYSFTAMDLPDRWVVMQRSPLEGKQEKMSMRCWVLTWYAVILIQRKRTFVYFKLENRI